VEKKFDMASLFCFVKSCLDLENAALFPLQTIAAERSATRDF